MNGVHLSILVTGVLIGSFYKDMSNWLASEIKNHQLMKAGYEYAKYYYRKYGNFDQLKIDHGALLNFTDAYDCGIAKYINEVHNED